jgi:hypothetical protein
MILPARTTLLRNFALSVAAIALTGTARETLRRPPHRRQPSAGATVPADVPSFARMANKPGQTAALIAGAIVVPHPPMPQTSLTRKEIGDVAAYTLALKGN